MDTYNLSRTSRYLRSSTASVAYKNLVRNFNQEIEELGRDPNLSREELFRIIQEKFNEEAKTQYVEMKSQASQSSRTSSWVSSEQRWVCYINIETKLFFSVTNLTRERIIEKTKRRFEKRPVRNVRVEFCDIYYWQIDFLIGDLNVELKMIFGDNFPYSPPQMEFYSNVNTDSDGNLEELDCTQKFCRRWQPNSDVKKLIRDIKTYLEFSL